MTATTFLLRARGRAELLGQALLCPTVRYASVHWAGAERLDRRFADLETWRAIEAELSLRLPSTPLADDNPIVHTLLGERAADVQLQYLSQSPIDETSAAATAGALDAHLRQVAAGAAPTLTLKR